MTEEAATDPPRTGTSVRVMLTDEPLSVRDALDDVQHPEAGGIGIFVGTVRNHHRGDAVDHLVYEAWEEEARPALEEVAGGVLERFEGVRAVHLSHRSGRLEIGDISVVVAASAPHRDEAIAATRALIDTLKERVPIWKQEHLADGTSRWPSEARSGA